MDLLDQFLQEDVPAKRFQRERNLGHRYLWSLARRTGRYERFRKHISNSLVRANHFSRIPEVTKETAMSEYLKSSLTTAQIGKKYGFHSRRLKEWFEKAGRKAEFDKKAKENVVGFSSQPKSASQLFKVSGKRAFTFKGQRLGIHDGLVKAILMNVAGKYVQKHRLVMEKYIGRKLLKTEVVHHVDLNPLNNKIKNLLLLKNHKEHGQLHAYLQFALVKILSEKQLRGITLDIYKIIQNQPSKREIKRKETNGDEQV